MPPPAADGLHHPALASLPPSLQDLARRGVIGRYRKGRLLIQEGERGDTLYLILRGRLRAFAANDQGREITYGIYGAGDYVGEMSLDGEPRSASVEALEACDCVLISRQTLSQHIAEHPDFAFELLAKVIRRARAATLTARQMALEDVYGRLRALLHALAGPVDAQGLQHITPRPTHKALAQRLGCSREMVSRLIKQLDSGDHLRADPAGDGWLLPRPLPMRW